MSGFFARTQLWVHERHLGGVGIVWFLLKRQMATDGPAVSGN
jgi:hypothetical protein